MRDWTSIFLVLILLTTSSISFASTNSTAKQCEDTSRTMVKLPTMVLCHGGGPFPLLNHPPSAPFTKHLKSIPKLLGKEMVDEVKSILIVTAHWEERLVTVSNVDTHSLYFDYYGFPDEAYKFKYPAPGSKELTARVRELLSEKGIKSQEDKKRGLDHGSFIPLMLAFPEPKIPVVQMSILDSLDPEEHIQIGEALEPLRSEGVLILGSGFSFHNMNAFFSGNKGDAKKATEFDSWLRDAVLDPDTKKRVQSLVDWEKAPNARFAHPREEHLIPLHVIMGAAGSDTASQIFSGTFQGLQASAFAFGDVNLTSIVA